jgi:glycosyltransferase involved in cell wall biosynthesis
VAVDRGYPFYRKNFLYHRDLAAHIRDHSFVQSRQLYGEANIFVFPSLYEGFGFPVLEAMACRCPVITSNISSLPEVVGDAALLVDPQDSHNISKAILQILENQELKTEMKARSLIQASNFSWSKTAQKMLTVLEDVAKH